MSPARDNGATFFDDEMTDIDIPGTIYFGSVKDDRGPTIAGANIVILVKSLKSEFVDQSRTLGRYASKQVAVEVDPPDVEVTVSKPGYQQVGRVNRSRHFAPGQPVEINFVMQATDAKAATK